MYQLTVETERKRTYKSSVTGTEISTYLLHTGGDGAKWWAFEDLLQIPFIRKEAAKRVTQLYGAGLINDDITQFIAEMKAVLKSNDTEKYEKAYSELLKLESLSVQTGDATKQSLALCTVYILADDERVDIFSMPVVSVKMEKWAIQIELQAFFLNWLHDGMINYTKAYKSITQIASTIALK